MLTPGSAETLAVKVYRIARIEGKARGAAPQAALTDYQTPVPLDTMNFPIASSGK